MLAAIGVTRRWVAAELRPAAPATAPDHWPVSFNDEFDSLNLFDGTSGRWQPHFPWAVQGGRSGRSIETNGELQLYVDRTYRGASELPLGLDPFSVADGILSIRADRTRDADRPRLFGYRFTSGMLTTARSFSQQYGYFEIRARLPKGRGLWPAYWLLPQDLSWPPEIDVFEVLGHDPTILHMTAHTAAAGRHSMRSFTASVPDMTRDFHTYGLLWTEHVLAWYFDGQRIAATETPQDMHKPMYMVINLAVGGKMPGDPDRFTSFPAAMQVDWVRARKLLPRR